jgi:RNA polymerase sigma-70 factor (ECF subfamily)
MIRRGDVEKALPFLQSTVFSFSMKVCGHREDAEDTMQEVLVKSLRYLREINDPQALAVWLYKVTRNRCWMSRRRSKFAPQQTLSLQDLMPDGEELESLAQHGNHSPERQAISNQETAIIHRAVLRIPPQYRLILVLHDMEDLTTDEVAKITGLREGTVRVRLHRARLFVRRELAATDSKPRKKAKRSRAKLECRHMFAGLSDYMDRRIDNLSCDRIQKHLDQCPPCVVFLEDLKRAVERCRTVEVSCDPKTSETIRKLLVNELARLSEEQPA